jgi:CRISPR/Cas system CMR subunit Cmr4 (Cas7 group RAMP superfamily)
MLVQLDYRLSFVAPFHFGTGIREGLIDRTVIRDTGDYLYVPASTLKGVLREQCEYLCHFYAHGDQARRRVPSPHDTYAALAELSGMPTLISRTFGSAIHPCGLFFSDARQPPNMPEIQKTYKSMQTSTFTQVRIDRLSGIAVDEALYTSQFGIPDLTFLGNITGQLDDPLLADLAHDMSDEEEPYTLTPTSSLLLLLAGLLLIERMGGNKSTGKGACQCTVTKLVLDRRLCPEEDWQGWLANLDVLSAGPVPEKGSRP